MGATTFDAPGGLGKSSLQLVEPSPHGHRPEPSRRATGWQTSLVYARSAAAFCCGDRSPIEKSRRWIVTGRSPVALMRAAKQGRDRPLGTGDDGLVRRSTSRSLVRMATRAAYVSRRIRHGDPELRT